MPAVNVATLVLNLTARTDAMEKELKRAQQSVKETAAAMAREGERASGFFDKIGLSGKEATGAIKNLTAGLLLSAGQMDGVSEKAKLVTESFGAFLAGGPIAGGIVAATGAFKIFAGELSKADEEARKRLAKMTEESVALAKRMQDEWKKAGEAARDAFTAGTRDIFKRGDEIRGADGKKPSELSRLADELKAAQDALASLRGPEVTGRRHLTADEQQRVLAIEMQIEAIETRIWNLKLDQEEADRNAAIAAADKLHTDEDAFLAEQRRLKELDALRLDTTRLGGSLSELLGNDTAAKAENTGRSIGQHVAKGMGEGMRDAIQTEVDPVITSMFSTVGDSLTSLIVDAMNNGAANASDIFRNLIVDLEQQLIHSMIAQLMSSILGGMGGGGGGGGIVSALVSGAMGGGDPLAGGSFPAGVSNEAGFEDFLNGVGLPGHASGGHFTTPHLAKIAEGGEGEWVVPDSKVPDFVRAQGAGGLVGDIHIHGTTDPTETANMAAEAVRSKILTSGHWKQGIRKANRTLFR